MASEDFDDAWQHLVATGRELLHSVRDVVRFAREHVLPHDPSPGGSGLGIEVPPYEFLRPLIERSFPDLTSEGAESLTLATLHNRRRVDSPLQFISRTRAAFSIVAIHPAYGSVSPAQTLRFVNEIVDNLGVHAPGQSAHSEPSSLSTFSYADGLRIELHMAIADAMTADFSLPDIDRS